MALAPDWQGGSGLTAGASFLQGKHSMDKQPRSQRHRTFKGGSISYAGAASTDCIIRNMSDTGACLEVSNTSGVPDNFKLIIKPEILTRSCEVVWRTEQRIGVRFK